MTITDATGAYNANTNTTGWGAPNVAIADVDSATVTVYGHDGTEYDPIDVLAILPNTNETPFILTPEDLGLTEGSDFPQGILTIDYQVTGISASTPFNYRARSIVSVMCEVECCVNEKMSEVDPLCGCTSGVQKKNVQAMLALEGINAAIACGKVSQARSLYDRLSAICNNQCKNC